MDFSFICIDATNIIKQHINMLKIDNNYIFQTTKYTFYYITLVVRDVEQHSGLPTILGSCYWYV